MIALDRKKMDRDLFIAHFGNIIRDWFDNIKNYINSVQPLFQKEEIRLLRVINEESKKRELEGDDWCCIEYDQFKNSFPSIHTNSLFISLWSEFDSSLNFICRALLHEKNKRKNTNISLPNWRGGSNLDTIKDFLKKEIDINFPWGSLLWRKINQINSIRNAITHNGGWLFPENDEKKDKQNDQIRQFIEERIKIPLEPTIKLIDDKIELNDKFLGEIITIIESFHHDLMKSISEWNKNK